MGVFSLKLTEKPQMIGISETVKDVEKKQDEEKSEISICLKYSLFLINFISFIFLGCALFGYGVYCLSSNTNRYPLETFWSINIILCAVGIVACIISFFGMLASIREHHSVLFTYKCLMGFVLLTEVIISIVVCFYLYIPASRGNVEFFPAGSFLDAMKSYPGSAPSDDSTVNSVDIIQNMLQCCGVSDNDEGYKDWEKVPRFKCEQFKSVNVFACTVPTSCCRLSQANNATCVEEVLRQRPIDVQGKIYIQGCLKGFHTWVEKNGLMIISVIIGILFLSVTLFFMIICFMNQVIRQLAKWENYDTEITSY